MKRSLSLLVLSLAACAAAAAQSADGIFATGAIGGVLDAWHAAAAAADEEKYFCYFTPDAVFLGTDATERWTRDEFRKWAHPYFAKGKAWSFKSVSRWITFAPDHTVAWFDETLETPNMGPCRGSGVLVATNSGWKIAQYNLSVPIPNDLVDEFKKRIEKRGKAPKPKNSSSPRAQTPNASAAPAPADLVLTNGAVYTVDGARSWAEAVAVSGGRIAFVGTDSAVKSWIGPKSRVVELAGKMVLPAFHDSHVHPILGGIEALECDLHGLETQEAVLGAIRAYAAAHPERTWIRGSGWSVAMFPDGGPSKTVLDRIVLDRPVYLEESDGHSAWVNSKALALAGVNRATPDPAHGRIEREAATGGPSGTLREEANDLVAKLLPPRTLNECKEGLRRALRIANGFGLTSLQEANASDVKLAAYAELDRSGELTARVSAAIGVDADKGLSEVPRLAALREKFRGNHLRADAAKIYADGVLETRTAALLLPYVGFGDDRGTPNLEPAAFNALAIALDREGFQIHVHAIGDCAIRMTLDAMEAARIANGARDSRHHIAHLELIDPADVPRFRRLGVIANFQPSWANGEDFLIDTTEPQLGPKRSRWLYPIRSVLDSGGLVAFGSDWNVSSMNPLDGIEVAVTHREPSKGPGPAWLPQEQIALPEAIAGYTIRGAYLDFTEKETGSIEVGKAADLIVLDRNLFEMPASQIHETKVLWTLLEGKEVYRAPGF